MNGPQSDQPTWKAGALSRRGAWQFLTAGMLGGLVSRRGLAKAASFVTDTPTATPRGVISPMFRGNAARTGEIPGAGPSGEPTLRWRFTTDGPVTSSPAVVDGLVYVGTSGDLFAVEATTGD